VEKMFIECSNKIVFIGVSQDDKGKIEDFVNKFELSFLIARDAENKIASTFNARMPTHVLIDVQGTIRYFDPSPPEIRDLEKILRWQTLRC
jgi:peroxiredoxin